MSYQPPEPPESPPPRRPRRGSVGDRVFTSILLFVLLAVGIWIVEDIFGRDSWFWWPGVAIVVGAWLWLINWIYKANERD